MWIALTNLVIATSWAICLVKALRYVWLDDRDLDGEACENLGVSVQHALLVSFLELVNALLGLTRSPILAVLLFSWTRFGVERLVSPMIPCDNFYHLLTIICWSLGDVVRFSTFFINTIAPGIIIVKSIRFTVGPILFPIGAFGEMMMVIVAGKLNKKPILYIAASLWPVFFYPMFQQLLKQRRKHFQSKTKEKVIKSV
jgi:hypothetical protein